MNRLFLAIEENLEPILAYVNECAAEFGIRRTKLLSLAVEEAVTNVILHSGSEGIEIDCASDGAYGIQIIIRDWGVAYNPLKKGILPDGDIGIGLHLMHKLVDSISYHRENNSNVLILRKEC